MQSRTKTTDRKAKAALKGSKASKSKQDSKCESGDGSRDSPTTPALHSDAGVEPMNTDSDDEPGGKENDDEGESAPPVPPIEVPIPSVQAIHEA